MRYSLVWAFLCLQVTYAFAHGDLHARIDTVSQLISLYPSNMDLYLRRAELYVQHDNYKSALADLKKCRRSGIRNDRIHLLMALANYHLGRFQRSSMFLRQISSMENDVDLLVLSGHVFMARKNFDSAVKTFEKAVSFSEQPNPERYIELSESLFQAGKPMQAIQTLEEAIVKLGLVPVLCRKLTNYLVDAGFIIRAIYVQSVFIQSQSRKEFALIHRAGLWIKAGLPVCADYDLDLAEQLIGKLPRRQRNQPWVDTLLQELQRLKAKI